MCPCAPSVPIHSLGSELIEVYSAWLLPYRWGSNIIRFRRGVDSLCPVHQLLDMHHDRRAWATLRMSVQVFAERGVDDGHQEESGLHIQPHGLL